MNEKYLKKEKIYFSSIRKEVLELIPKEKRKGEMLEIGAGTGATLIYAKQNEFAEEVYGIDLFELEGQNNSLIKKFIVGNIEEMNIQYLENKFDIILFLDVLEHLIDPINILEKIKKNLKNDGLIIISLPNFREIKNMYRIFFKGDFKYQNSGILDETHLRFFCKKNLIELCEKTGYKINSIIPQINWKRKKLNNMTFKIFEEFLSTQYLLVLEKIER